MEEYSTDESALRYFGRMRWGDKPACVKCGCSGRLTAQKKFPGRWWCGDCRSYFTALTGTPLEYGKIRMRKWLVAAYLLLTARKGISAMQLSKEVKVSYPTAWYMLHRLRLVCGNKLEAMPLRGEIEIDETYLGGKERNKHESKKMKAGRGAVGKQAVLGMRERLTGRVRALPIPDTTSETMRGAVGDAIGEGSMLYTDEHGGYEGLEKRGYRRKSVNYSAKQFVDGMASTNGIESVWAVLKRGFYGTYHHWSVKHCRAYVGEFCFRLNKEDRLDSLFRAMAETTITYEDLTA